MRRILTIWGLSVAAALAQTTVTGSKTVQGNWDASGANTTKPAKTGASLPATCSSGEVFFNTAASSGQNIYLCQPANTWTQVTGGSGSLPAAGGDLSGTLTSATVRAIQGQAVAATTPSMGQVLTWGGSSWGAQTLSGSGGGGSVAEADLIFDGSTSIGGETMSAWSCSSGVCSSNWTAPSGVNWVYVQMWGAGGGGSGSAGGGGVGGGGGGGGFWSGVCPTTPGAAVAIGVGQGGSGGHQNPWAGNGGSSSFGACMSVTGGKGGDLVPYGFGGIMNAASSYGAWLQADDGSGNVFTVFVNQVTSACARVGAAGGMAARFDAGGCGAGWVVTSGAAGQPGGSAPDGGGGGGGGSYNNATSVAGGVSALGNTLYTNGGNGGNGGGWTSGGGLLACGNGVAPGGGGGAAGVETGAVNITGCNGARGEVRVYYLH